MGLFDKLRNELVDIIEWVDNTNRTLVWRFPRYQNEIKNGAQLIVRPGQKAVFVHRGQMADVFEPGNYALKTENLPILSTLQGWKYGFNSPFKSEVYFVSTRQITDLKWGTPNPIMLRDADFGPVRVRAFGTYAVKAVDPKALLKELVGTDAEFDADEDHRTLAVDHRDGVCRHDRQLARWPCSTWPPTTANCRTACARRWSSGSTTNTASTFRS